MAIFTRAQSNPQFQPPGFNPNPQYPRIDVGATLDSVFDAYTKGRQLATNQQTADLQQQQLQGQIAAQDASQTAQFGQPLRSVEPQRLQQAALGQEAPFVLAPEKVAALNRLKEGLARLGGRDPQTLAGQERKAQADTADIRFTNARAAALEGGQVFVDPDTGKSFSAPSGAKLLPRTPVGKGVLKNEDQLAAFNLYETAREGLISGLSASETGPIVGRLPSFTSAQQVAEGGVAAMAPVLKQLFRVSGEGVFTDRDQQLLLDMVPTRTDRPEARQQKIQNIDNIVKAKLRIGEDAASTPAPRADLSSNPEAVKVRADFKAGRITREQANAALGRLTRGPVR